MNTFFTERIIHIDLEGAERVTLTMRPLKIRELPGYLRCLKRLETNNSHSRATSLVALHGRCPERIIPELIDIIAVTVDKSLYNLPSVALSHIIDVFMDLNFPESRDVPAGRLYRQNQKSKIRNLEDGAFAMMLDFLISQGHRYADILEYTLPQFRQFIEASVERLTGIKKKKKEPLEALLGLGIPIRKKL